MGVWEGIFKGSEAADARKERDKDFALKTKIFDENKRMGRLDSLSKYVSTYQNESGGSSFTGTGKKVASLQGSEHYINILSDMGIDQDAIARVAGTGARNLQSVVTELSGAAETFLKNNGRDAPLPLDIFNTAISGAILTQPSGPTIDMDEVQKAFGIELSQSELLMIKPAKRAPSLTMKPGALTITQVASLEDLGRIDKQGIQYSVSLGNSELAKLTKRSAQLVTLSEQGALDDVTTAEQAWVTQRMTEVQGAISSVKDGDNFLPIASLYGTEFIQNVMSSYPSFKNAPINPAWKAEAVPMTVPNRAVAQRLIDIGVIKPPATIFNQESQKLIRIEGN